MWVDYWRGGAKGYVTFRTTYHHDMTIAVYCGRKVTKQIKEEGLEALNRSPE